MAKKKGNSNNNHRALKIGAVVAGVAAAAAAGAYYLSTPTGKRHMKEMKGWMLKAKGEVMEKLEEAKELNRETYEKIVDEVTTGYKKLKKVDAKELALLVAELKAQWDNIRDEATRDVTAAKRAKRRVTKQAKKVAGPRKKTNSRKTTRKRSSK